MNTTQSLFLIFAIVVVMIVAAAVGVTRADAARECFKAAQVNINIKCEPPNETR